MESRVELIHSGDRTLTSCTHEWTCVGAVNALANWASQTDGGHSSMYMSTCLNFTERASELALVVTVNLTLNLSYSSAYSTKGGQHPSCRLPDHVFYFLISLFLMSTLTVCCQSVRGRPGRLLLSIGFQLVACLAILRESILMTCPTHLSLSLMVSTIIPCWASSLTSSLFTLSFHEMCKIFLSHLWWAAYNFLVVCQRDLYTGSPKFSTTVQMCSWRYLGVPKSPFYNPRRWWCSWIPDTLLYPLIQLGWSI